MIYHRNAPTGWMSGYCMRFSKDALLNLNEIYATLLGSPGTKAYSVNEGKDLTKLLEKVT